MQNWKLFKNGIYSNKYSVALLGIAITPNNRSGEFTPIFMFKIVMRL